MGDHTETVQIVFNPEEISYAQLLEVFWNSHNPLYNGSSRQYRNAIFYLSDAQRQQAEQSRDQLAASRGEAIKTHIENAGEFYLAEAYHQKYLLQRADGILYEFQEHYPEVQQFIASTAAARLNGYLGCNGRPEDLEREIGLLGLSPEVQNWLVEYVARSCQEFAGMTCPSPVRNVEED